MCSERIKTGSIHSPLLFERRSDYIWLSKPTPLIEDGKPLAENLRREVMTQAKLERSIRKHELDPDTDLPLIKGALLEQDGTVTILHKNESDKSHRRKTVGKLPGKE